MGKAILLYACTSLASFPYLSSLTYNNHKNTLLLSVCWPITVPLRYIEAIPPFTNIRDLKI